MVISAYQYKPTGVCSKNIIFTVNEEGRVIDLRIIGGCPGNLLGIRALVQNEKLEDVISKLDGIKCGNKDTSCPDQIAKAFTEYLNKQREGE